MAIIDQHIPVNPMELHELTEVKKCIGLKLDISF